MKTFRKGCAFLATATVAVLVLAGCASTGGLTESQKVGVKNSPAALMSIYVSPEAEWVELSDESYARMNDGKKFLSESGKVKSHVIPESMMGTSAQELKAALEQAGGFTFVNAAVVNDALTEAIEDADKKAGWNTVKSLLKGDVGSVIGSAALNVADAALVEAEKAMGVKQYPLVTATGYLPATPRQEDLTKAVVKAAKKNKEKAASLVYATVEYSIESFAAANVPTKAYCLTNVYITDDKGKLIKQVNSVVFSSPMNYKDFIANPTALIEKFPMLMRESIEQAAGNLDVKLGLFEVPKLELETERLISDGPYGFHPANHEHFTEGGK